VCVCVCVSFFCQRNAAQAVTKVGRTLSLLFLSFSRPLAFSLSSFASSACFPFRRSIDDDVSEECARVNQADTVASSSRFAIRERPRDWSSCDLRHASRDTPAIAIRTASISYVKSRDRFSRKRSSGKREKPSARDNER